MILFEPNIGMLNNQTIIQYKLPFGEWLQRDVTYILQVILSYKLIKQRCCLLCSAGRIGWNKQIYFVPAKGIRRAKTNVQTKTLHRVPDCVKPTVPDVARYKQRLWQGR